MDRGKHLVEQFSGAPDEGQALAILIAARRFADEHDAARRIAVGKDGVGGGSLQRAAIETFKRRFQLGERIGGAGKIDRSADRVRFRAAALLCGGWVPSRMSPSKIWRLKRAFGSRTGPQAPLPWPRPLRLRAATRATTGIAVLRPFTGPFPSGNWNGPSLTRPKGDCIRQIPRPITVRDTKSQGICHGRGG